MKKWLKISLIVFGLIVLLLGAYVVYPIFNGGGCDGCYDLPYPDTSDEIKCLPEQRNVDACIEIYQPVCGFVNVECVTAPCDPVVETFENSCKACSNERVEGYVEGVC